MINSESGSIKIFLVNITTKNLSNQVFIINSALKTNLGTYKTKELNGEKVIGKFYEKHLLLIILYIRYYPESACHIKFKINAVLNFLIQSTIYVTKKELDHATGVDTSDLAAKNYFIAFKAKVDKLDINKPVNIPRSLYNVKTKVCGIDIGNSRTVPVDLKKLNDVVNNEVVKYWKFNTVKKKVYNLEKKIPDAIILHNSIQNRKNFEKKKIGDTDKKYQIQIT